MRLRAKMNKKKKEINKKLHCYCNSYDDTTILETFARNHEL
uniref:Uncharacterized protein n=1 Tax=Rhizophora mucronata TaxID=61149 RepID=A0A2P2QXM1_RHIMU